MADVAVKLAERAAAHEQVLEDNLPAAIEEPRQHRLVGSGNGEVEFAAVQKAVIRRGAGVLPLYGGNVGVCTLTVESVRRRFVQHGLHTAVYRREQTNRKARVLDGRAEAFLLATVCSAPPDGQARWSLTLLRDTLIEGGYVASVSGETVRQTLKKRNSSPG